ncbi:hypothetical protein [Microbacterium sp. MYb62]|uniref:hypothetical protein n=1 Tax=Microbacterium sp. MYb62 TaxID=1848690 RepID=UPI000CFAEBFE|nr:hypothetical protein [Microbacterium sp. MYb62]PRB12205.1 hypothetical protein CQ042_15440 [Microbacterium sp. MYb62]
MTASRRWPVIATVIAIPAAVIVIVGIVFVVMFFVSVQDKDGDDVALNRVEHVARALADDLRGAHDLTDAETVAAEMFHSRSAIVEPLTWTGAFGTDDGITIQTRISASVEASSSGAMFAPYTSAGSAERCYRYTVVVFREAAYDEIPCQGLPQPPAPPASTSPALPGDATARIDGILMTTDPADLAEALRQEFPGDRFRVEAIETPAGEQVVAVGVTPGTDCVLRVRRTDGEVVSPPYDRIWLEPGELGCSTRLYTAPPQ